MKLGNALKIITDVFRTWFFMQFYYMIMFLFAFQGARNDT